MHCQYVICNQLAIYGIRERHWMDIGLDPPNLPYFVVENLATLNSVCLKI